MKKVSFLSILWLCVLVVGCRSEKAPKNDTSLIQGAAGERLDSILTPYVQTLRNLTDNTAGLAIGVTQGDSIIYARTFGFANIEKNKKADFNTVFHIASVSKPFTAAAVAKLVQQGKLKLEDSIIHYLPEFKMKGTGYEKITIKHILTHTSGIPRHISSDDWLNPITGPNALEENVRYVKDFELDFEPGTQFSYSNSAFDILGIVVARASGMPFHDYVTTNILLPSGMTQSTYLKPLDSLPPHWAVPYSYGLETQEWSPYPYTENYFPSSGLQTTLLDMCHWGMMLANKGIYRNVQVLNEVSFNLMVTPSYETPWGDKIGLSWYLKSYLDRPIIMHTGSDTGFESLFYVYPEEKISITVLANRDFARTGRIINAVSEVLFNETPKEYNTSAKYKFTEAYKTEGLEKAKHLWNKMKKDTTDAYFTEDGDILTTGAVLENGKKWNDAKAILEYYITLNEESTYAWRLLGNANLNLGDTTEAIRCYKQTLTINPDYEKGREALDAILKLVK